MKISVAVHIIAFALVFAALACSTTPLKVIKSKDSPHFMIKTQAELSEEELSSIAQPYCKDNEQPVFIDHAIVPGKLDAMTKQALRQLNRVADASLRKLPKRERENLLRKNQQTLLSEISEERLDKITNVFQCTKI